MVTSNSMKHKNRKIFNNTAFMTGSSLLARAIAYLYFLIIIRSFSTTEIGIYAILITSYLLMELVGNLGLDKIMIRDLSKRTEESFDGVLFYSSLFMKLVSSIVVWGISLTAFMTFFPVQLSNYQTEFIIFFASIAPLCLARSLESYYTAGEKMHIPAASQLLERIILLAAAWIVSIGLIGFRGFLIAFFIAVCGRALLLSSIFTWRRSDIRTELLSDKVKALGSESIRMLPIEAMALIYFRVDIFMLSKMTDLRITGIYQVAYKIFDFFIAMFAGFLIAVFPTLSREKGESSLLYMALIGIGAMSAISLGIIYFRIEILGFFQKDFIQGSRALIWLMLTLPLVYLNSLLAHYAIAINKTSVLFRMAIILVAANIGLNLVFIPRFSIAGAAAATMICELLSTVLMLILLKDSIRNLRRPRVRP